MGENCFEILNFSSLYLFGKSTLFYQKIRRIKYFLRYQTIKITDQQQESSWALTQKEVLIGVCLGQIAVAVVSFLFSYYGKTCECFVEKIAFNTYKKGIFHDELPMMFLKIHENKYLWTYKLLHIFH